MYTTFQNIDFLISDIKSELKKTLPGVESQAKMISQYQRKIIKYFNDNQKLRDAAVLIVLFNENERLKTIFIERMPDPGPHSGQIAFPGGRKEDTDKDLIETSIREAEEEIGVNVKKDDIIGELTSVEIPVSGYSVLPVVCFVNKIPQLTRCQYEVKNILTADVFELFNSKTTRQINVRGDMVEVPCYILDDQVIWGATAMVLSELEEVFNRILIHQSF